MFIIIILVGDGDGIFGGMVVIGVILCFELLKVNYI